jgi:radical SAM protein with 4Fe4S-binding SPASM domain
MQFRHFCCLYYRLMNLKQFKRIYVEITNVCNLRCGFCPANKRPQGFMPLKLFSDVIKKIEGHTHYIYLHVKGEPLLHPQLSDILDLCYEKKLCVVLVTNGTLLADKAGMLLEKPALRQINISLHCYSELHQYKNKNEYIKAVIAFVKQALLQSNKMISLRFWNIEKGNQDNHQGNQSVLDEIEQEFAPGFDLTQILKPGKGLKLNDHLYVNSDFEFSWPDILSNYDNPKGSCYGLRDQLAVLYDGTVVPCCLDAEGIINLGNIQNNEIQQIFDSPKAQKIYNGFLQENRVEPLCRKCQFNRKNNE